MQLLFLFNIFKPYLLNVRQLQRFFITNLHIGLTEYYMLQLPTFRNTELTNMNVNYYSGRFKIYYYISKLQYKLINCSYLTYLRRAFRKLGTCSALCITILFTVYFRREYVNKENYEVWLTSREQNLQNFYIYPFISIRYIDRDSKKVPCIFFMICLPSTKIHITKCMFSVHLAYLSLGAIQSEDFKISQQQRAVKPSTINLN